MQLYMCYRIMKSTYMYVPYVTISISDIQLYLLSRTYVSIRHIWRLKQTSDKSVRIPVIII